jgi:signal transduction histidine kinase
MRLSLNRKISLGICLIVVVIMSSVMVIQNFSITGAVTKKIHKDLLEAKEIFGFIQKSHFEELLTINRALVEVPQLKAAITTTDLDYATVFDIARHVQLSVKSDLFMLLDAQGKLLASVSDPGRRGDDLSQTPIFQSISKGREYQGNWKTAQGVYQIVATPFVFDGNVAGVLVSGYLINQETVYRLAKMTKSDVWFATPEEVIGSSLAQPGPSGLWDEFFSTHALKIRDMIIKSFDRQQYLLLTVPLEQIQGGYILARSMDQELLFFRRLQRQLLFLGIGLLIIAIVTGIWYIRRITRPIGVLVEQARCIALGDLSSRVECSSTDEIGDLARAFNDMAGKLKEFYEDLEQKVTDRTIALSKAISELQQTHDDLKQVQSQLFQSEKLASIGQLAAGVAHEINNPVGFISNNMEILQEYIGNYARILRAMEGIKQQVESGDAHKARAAVEELKKLEKEIDLDYMVKDVNALVEHSRRGLERIRKIVLDLRTFSREENAETMELVKVEEVIDSIFSIVQSEIKYKAELSRDYGSTAFVKGNSQRLGQVFINLLFNAFQAIDGNGKISLKTYLQDKYVCIDIIDTGKGIAAEHIEKIFDPFFTTKPVGQGTGLGLSVSYEIVNKHGGEIKVQSKVGVGTTFTVMLPAAE